MLPSTYHIQGTRAGVGSREQGEAQLPLRHMVKQSFSNLSLHLSHLEDYLKLFPGALRICMSTAFSSKVDAEGPGEHTVRSPVTVSGAQEVSLLLAYLTVTKKLAPKHFPSTCTANILESIIGTAKYYNNAHY